MLTLRRGFVRLGWVLLFGWLALFGAIAIFVDRPPGTDVSPAVLAFVAVPSTIFLLWRLLLWIGQGFWQEPATPNDTAPILFHLGPEFWTVRTMALLGAVLFAAYGAFGLRAEWAFGRDYASRAVGSTIAYAAVGAIVGAVMASFLHSKR
jgi:hypothetical protein